MKLDLIFSVHFTRQEAVCPYCKEKEIPVVLPDQNMTIFVSP